MNTNKYIGIPFVDGGRDESGADCWGLAKIIYSDIFGIDLPDYSVSALDTKSVIDNMEEGKKLWRKVERPEVGTLITMAIHPKYQHMTNHVGVYMGRGMFIHTQARTGCILTKINDIIYSPSITGFFKWAT